MSRDPIPTSGAAIYNGNHALFALLSSSACCCGFHENPSDRARVLSVRVFAFACIARVYGIPKIKYHPRPSWNTFNSAPLSAYKRLSHHRAHTSCACALRLRVRVHSTSVYMYSNIGFGGTPTPRIHVVAHTTVFHRIGCGSHARNSRSHDADGRTDDDATRHFIIESRACASRIIDLPRVVVCRDSTRPQHQSSIFRVLFAAAVRISSLVTIIDFVICIF